MCLVVAAHYSCISRKPCGGMETHWRHPTGWWHGLHTGRGGWMPHSRPRASHCLVLLPCITSILRCKLCTMRCIRMLHVPWVLLTGFVPALSCPCGCSGGIWPWGSIAPLSCSLMVCHWVSLGLHCPPCRWYQWSVVAGVLHAVPCGRQLELLGCNCLTSNFTCFCPSFIWTLPCWNVARNRPICTRCVIHRLLSGLRDRPCLLALLLPTLWR